MSDFLKKPEFPKARLIREDFLPNDMLKNYRILKTQDKECRDVYYPQYKFLGLFWLYMNAHEPFRYLDWAIDYIKRDFLAKRKPKVEYIEITEKDLNLPEKNPIHHH